MFRSSYGSIVRGTCVLRQFVYVFRVGLNARIVSGLFGRLVFLLPGLLELNWFLAGCRGRRSGILEGRGVFRDRFAVCLFLSKGNF